MSLKDRVRIEHEEVLADRWAVLKTTRLQYRRSDGRWQTQQRETYDRGDGVAVLLYHAPTRQVVLTRQFRFPAFVKGYHEPLVEVPAGTLDEGTAEERMRAEIEEETGFRVGGPLRPVFRAFMSPGSVTERVHCFVAPYDPAVRDGEGGGVADEGEDIEVFQPTLDEALAMIERGEICDAKTIMLLQYAALHLMAASPR